MSDHGHESHADTSHSNKSEGSGLEKAPIIGTFISMLKTIASVEGLKSFMDKMAQDHLYPVIMKLPDAMIGVFFGAGEGGGGHAAPAHAH